MMEQCKFWLNSQIFVRLVAGSSASSATGRATNLEDGIDN
jgi:hypothetical protein